MNKKKVLDIVASPKTLSISGFDVVESIYCPEDVIYIIPKNRLKGNMKNIDDVFKELRILRRLVKERSNG
jgi:hypothetical protein